MHTIDKKSRIFFALFFLAVLVSIVFMFYRTMLARNYDVIDVETTTPNG